MTREEMKKYLEDRRLEVVLDDDEDIHIDGAIIATWNRAYLKINRSSNTFMTSPDGIGINAVTEKDLDKFISSRARWIKNYDKRIRRERIMEFRKAVKKHREEEKLA